jgi:hypothetical protein
VQSMIHKRRVKDICWFKDALVRHCMLFSKLFETTCDYIFYRLFERFVSMPVWAQHFKSYLFFLKKKTIASLHTSEIIKLPVTFLILRMNVGTCSREINFCGKPFSV